MDGTKIQQKKNYKKKKRRGENKNTKKKIERKVVQLMMEVQEERDAIKEEPFVLEAEREEKSDEKGKQEKQEEEKEEEDEEEKMGKTVPTMEMLFDQGGKGNCGWKAVEGAYRIYIEEPGPHLMEEMKKNEK